jgi:exopolyphosphatase/guanosine-5'-triphosphate,3'-diphosphate pyrophosphatase
LTTQNFSSVAAIDIGSNSVHLAIGRLLNNHGIELIDTEKVPIQLGRALDENSMLSADAIAKTATTIAALAQICQSHTKQIRVVATHATREARNTQHLIEAIRSRSGLNAEVIDGLEEARLCFLGVRHGLPVGQDKCLSVDVGGGSTEIILAQGDKIEFVTSLKLGAVTLTKQFLNKDKPTDQDLERLKHHIASQTASLNAIAKDARFQRAILSSGTAKTLANIDVYLHHGEELDEINGHQFSAEVLKNIMQRLIAMREPKKIRTRLNVSQSRSEIILAGALIIEQITKLFNVSAWQFSSYSLREGLIVDTLQKRNNLVVLPADQLRSVSLQTFAQNYRVDLAYSQHVSILAKQVYDFLEPILIGKQSADAKRHNLELLDAACLLHEIGKYLSPANYHRHSAYLVANSAAAGFTQYEKYLIGYTILNHRKGGAKPEMLGWEHLYYENLSRIALLSGCLRIATCLNRTRRAMVQRLRIASTQEGFEISVSQAMGDIEAEQRKLDAELKFLSKLFSCNVKSKWS